MLEINENTKLVDIMKEYPWIGEEAAKMSDRLKIINTPFGRAVIARARISDISRKTGFPPELIIEKINEVISTHLDRERS